MGKLGEEPPHLPAVVQTRWKMKPIMLTLLLVTSMCSILSGQAKGQSKRRVVLPNAKLVRCMTSDCFQLLQDDPPRRGDIYPEHIDVAFLDQWCPYGVTAKYNKAVSFEDLRDALEKRYGKGTAKDFPHGHVMIWEVQSDSLFIELDIADRLMAQNQLVEEGTKSVHYTYALNKICPMR